MQDLVKGQFEWHNAVNANFHELDTKKVDNNNLVESTGYGVVTGLEVLAQETPNMTVKVNSGIVYMPNGARVNFEGNDSVAISPADAENPRVDIVYINTDGTVGYIAGVPFTTPIAPDTPEGAFLLAKINVAVGAVSIVSGNITDMRKIKNNLDEHVAKKATQTDLGHVKKGTDINIDASGVISVDSGNAAGKILKLPAGLTSGDMLYVNSSGQLVRLPKGGEAQALLTLDGKPTWGTGMASSKLFDTPGTYTWTVPAGVKVVKVTGCAAGGGGGGGNFAGSSGTEGTDGLTGGVTSFGTLVTLNGGSGGTKGGFGTAGQGANGGSAPSNVYSLFAVGGNNGSPGALHDGRYGAHGGNGGNGFINFGSYGNGGKGGNGADYGSTSSNGGNSGGGGGGGCFINRYIVNVTPGAALTIAIGLGGSGGSGGVDPNDASHNGLPGEKGGNGILIIEW